MMDNKCIICGKSCKYPWSICLECQEKAKEEKKDYLKHLGYEVEENAQKLL